MNSSLPTAGPSPDPIFQTLTAYQRSAALRAAIELGLYGALGDGADAASLAKHCNSSERGMRILCDYLTVIGLMQKKDGKYLHTEDTAVFLNPASPACLASTARFLSDPQMQEPYARLADIVREGHTSLPGEGSVEPNNPIWVEFAESMAPMMGVMAPPLAGTVLKDLSGPIQVLDIAAGHGLFGIEIARREPLARVTALDWESVLQVAQRNAKKAGIEDRYTLLPGSAFDAEYGGPYDAVLLTNFLHHFDRKTCVGLLRKVHAALKPGGKAATLEFVPNEDRVSPASSAGFSMTMLASTQAGDAYTFSELESMYREAGFPGAQCIPIPQTPQTIVIGTKS